MIRKPLPAGRGKAIRSPSSLRYKLTVEYDGTGYSGWQVQKNARSIQGTLIDAARTLRGLGGPTRASMPSPKSPTSRHPAVSRRRKSSMV